jgi:hypothetical protein
MEINVKKLVTNESTHELLKLAYILDKDAVKKAFRNVGFIVNNDKDLRTLATLHDNGGDVAGVLKNKYGRRLYFDVEQILMNTKSSFADKFHSKKLNLNWD